MSDHVYVDDAAKTTDPGRSLRSMWMDRWMTTSCNSTLQVQNQFCLHDENGGKDPDLEKRPMVVHVAEPSRQRRLDRKTSPYEIPESRNSWRWQSEDIVAASNVPQSAQSVGAVTEAQRVTITYEKLEASYTDERNSRSELRHNPLFNFSGKKGSIFTRKDLSVSAENETKTRTINLFKPGSTAVEASKSRFLSTVLRLAPTEATSPLKEHHSVSDARLLSQRQLAKPLTSIDKKSGLPVLTLFQDNLCGSNSDSAPYMLKSREAQSYVCRKKDMDGLGSQVPSKDHLKSTNSTPLQHENHNYLNYSSYLLRNKEMNDNLGSWNSGKLESVQKSGTPQLNDFSPSNLRFPVSIGETVKHEFNTGGLLSTRSCPGKLRRLDGLNNGCHSSSDVPQPIHYSDKLRLSSSVAYMDVASGGPKSFQTTNHLSPKNMSKGKQILRESSISSNLKESASAKLFTLLPDFDYHDECGEKLPPSGISRNSERKRDEQINFLALRDESSGETETMDINACQTWNSLPSTTSSPSNMDAKVGQHPVMVHPTKQREKVGSRMTEELLDINRESPSSVAAEKAIDSIDLSTSKTDSLDVEHLLHADQAGNSNSGSQQCLLPGLDPSCRWVKRLRLNLSDNHSHSTKNAEIGDCSRTAVMNKLYRKITDHRTSSGPTSSKVLDKGVGEMELEDTLLLLGKKESASMDPVKESRELNLSHPWIHRWCHSQTRDIKSVAPVACDMDSSRTAVDEYKTKQFPSIAAMALMGKTVNGLQACKFQNKGSFVVWKTGQF